MPNIFISRLSVVLTEFFSLSAFCSFFSVTTGGVRFCSPGFTAFPLDAFLVSNLIVIYAGTPV